MEAERRARRVSRAGTEEMDMVDIPFRPFPFRESGKVVCAWNGREVGLSSCS